MVLMGSCFLVAKAVLLSMRADIILLGGCTHQRIVFTVTGGMSGRVALNIHNISLWCVFRATRGTCRRFICANGETLGSAKEENDFGRPLTHYIATEICEKMLLNANL